MGVSIVSPELALVDPTLRHDLIAALPPVEEYGFLEFPASSTVVPLGARVEPAPRRRPPLLVAAAAYLVSSATRVAVMDALFVLGLGGAIACLQLVG